MPAITGQPITPAVLAENWDGVLSAYGRKDEMYETHVHEIDWSDSTTNPIVVWVPPVDAQILGITVTTRGGTTGSIEVQITGNLTISGNKYTITVTNGAIVRNNLLATQARVKVGGGDAIVFQDTQAYDPTAPEQFRIHILYQVRWSTL